MYRCVSIVLVFLIPTLKALDSLIPFILPLVDDGHVSVSEDMFRLRFNLNIRSMYLEQEMYTMDGDILKKISMQNNKIDDSHVILGLGLFRVISFQYCVSKQIWHVNNLNPSCSHH